MTNKTYNEQIDWLFNQFPNYQNLGDSAYKPGLENTFKLLGLFDNPHHKVKSIHIAGTNGKGSVCSYLASILKESGLKVGLFTSPHIWDFKERIRINGEKIKEDFVIDFCEKIRRSNFDFEPSFFEITFAMAMHYFSKNKCDLCIIETGMGGRLDATNTLAPSLSIITNIGLDHTQFLGNDLMSIAKEKAGIIKEQTPILIGPGQPEILSVFKEQSENHKSTLFISKKSPYQSRFLDIHYKKVNFDLALSALDILDISYNTKLLDQALNNLFSNTGFMGRFFRIHSKPDVYIDVAHNKEGVETLLSKFSNHTNLQVIYGSSKDKNYKELIEYISNYASIALSSFSNKRSIPIDELNELKRLYPKIKNVYENIQEALEKTMENSQKDSTIIICGSFFLLADLKLSPSNQWLFEKSI